MTQKPVPLKPKLPDQLTQPNTFAYLTTKDRVYIAGLIDGIGRFKNGRILKTTNAQKLISYKLDIEGYTSARAGILKAAELLGLKVTITGARDKHRITVPEDRIDDLMAVLKQFLTADKYNKYVRIKYLSELSQFQLGRSYYDYDTGKPRMLFKGIDWQQVDELLAQPDITPGMINSINNARIATQKLVTDEE